MNFMFEWQEQYLTRSLRSLVRYYSCTREDMNFMWREDMNFMFEWQEQYLTSERSERVRYCSCTRISSSQRVMFFLLYGD